VFFKKQEIPVSLLKVIRTTFQKKYEQMFDFDAAIA